MFLLLIVVFLYLIVVALFVFILVSTFYSDFKGAPFVANQKNVIKDSLSFAKVNKKDKLCDIGSGDGYVLDIACVEYGVMNLFGIEVSLWPYMLSKLRFFYKRKRHRYPNDVDVNIVRKNIFDYDLNGFTVIYAYLFPELLAKLSDKLFDFLKQNPDSRIVTPVFEIKWSKKNKSYINKKVMKSYNYRWRKEINIYLYTFNGK